MFRVQYRNFERMLVLPYGLRPNHSEVKMRGILLWAVGIPIPVVILLYLFHVI